MRISKLEPSKHKQGRFLVHLDNGDILRVGEGEIISFSLYSGMELSQETRARLESASRAGSLRERSLNMLTARPMSRKELIERLTARPRDREKAPLADAEEAGEVADWLERLGLINDEEYAKSVVRHYSAKGFGPYKLKDELYRRGVPKALWEGAMTEAAGPETAIDAFLRQKLKGGQADRKELKRVSDALARRGYRWEDISAGLRRCGAGMEEE